MKIFGRILLLSAVMLCLVAPLPATAQPLQEEVKGSTGLSKGDNPLAEDEAAAAGQPEDNISLCDKGDGEACYQVAQNYFKGFGADSVKKPEKARLYFDKACAAGVGNGCQLLGFMIERGQGGPADVVEARKKYQQGCNLDSPGACFNLGVACEAGLGAPKDLFAAAAFYQKACRLGQQDGCHNAGALQSGSQLADMKDDYSARLMFLEACNLGRAVDCTIAGGYWEHGTGGAQDYGWARSLYEKGCEGGNNTGCFNFGVFLRYGYGGPKDEVKAVASYKKACDLGMEKACTELGATPTVP